MLAGTQAWRRQDEQIWTPIDVSVETGTLSQKVDVTQYLQMS
ncbi:MAG TPA: hypothetical protein VFI58_22935 [Xanthobacteraceae bacterium]|nr:hypothetical protein [Xanthobacteraceae bacterium]